MFTLIVDPFCAMVTVEKKWCESVENFALNEDWRTRRMDDKIDDVERDCISLHCHFNKSNKMRLNAIHGFQIVYRVECNLMLTLFC